MKLHSILLVFINLVLASSKFVRGPEARGEQRIRRSARTFAAATGEHEHYGKHEHHGLHDTHGLHDHRELANDGLWALNAAKEEFQLFQKALKEKVATDKKFKEQMIKEKFDNLLKKKKKIDLDHEHDHPHENYAPENNYAPLPNGPADPLPSLFDPYYGH